MTIHNVEYHFAQPDEIGFYGGIGLVGFKNLVPYSGPFQPPSPDQYDWKIGGQIYVGLDIGALFIEVGIAPILDAQGPGTVGFLPRFLMGFHIFL